MHTCSAIANGGLISVIVSSANRSQASWQLSRSRQMYCFNIENLVLWASGSESLVRDNPPEADQNQMSRCAGYLTANITFME
jgi:hypothetical protein